MRKILLILILALSSSIAFVSCEKEEDYKESIIGTSWVWHSGTSNTTTKSNASSMLGRAVIGGVVGGGAGAIIGGLSGTKKSETINNITGETMHDYCINITVNSIKNPLLKLEFAENRKRMEKISAILSVIININQQNNFQKQ